MSDIDELEQTVLAGARRALSPSTQSRHRVRAAVLAGVGVKATAAGGVAASAAAGKTVGAAAPAASFATWLTTKTALVSIALGGTAGLGTYEVLKTAESEPAAPAAIASTPVSKAARVATPAPIHSGVGMPWLESTSAKAPQHPPRPLSTPAQPRVEASALSREIALLRRAQGAVSNGAGAEALGLLDDLDREFPRGSMMQERTVARVLALCATGRTREARKTAERLLGDNPNSLYAARLKSSCAFPNPNKTTSAVAEFEDVGD